MPTVRNIPGPYRIFFYSFDCTEPPHVHVQRDKQVSKFWLEPLMLQYNHGFTGRELRRIHHLLEEHFDNIWEAWYEHCGEDFPED